MGGADEPETATIYLLSWKGGVSPNRLILVGIGDRAVVAAGSTFLTVRFPIERVRPAIVWTMDSIYGGTWRDVVTLLAVLVVAAPLAVGLTVPLRALQVVVGCTLGAVSVAIAGPVGLIALMVPHAVATDATAPDHRGGWPAGVGELSRWFQRCRDRVACDRPDPALTTKAPSVSPTAPLDRNDQILNRESSFRSRLDLLDRETGSTTSEPRGDRTRRS